MDEALSRKVWECRNMPEIRLNMSNPDPIRLEDHLMFVDKLTVTPNKHYYSVLWGGVFIGSVNVQFIDNETVERGIYLDPKFWGKGLSKLISKEFYDYLHNKRNVLKVRTRVFKSNKPSNALAISIGAKMVSSDDKYNYYEFDLN